MFDVIKRVNKTRAWIILTVTILALGTLLNPIKTRANIPDESLQRDLLGAVEIFIVDGQMQMLGSCTGTYLGDGVIVTNWHCVGHTDLYGPDDTGLGLKNGDTYNPDGIVVIAPQTDPRQVPKPTYMARVAAGNPDIDVAVVKIYRMLDPKANLPASIPIPAIPLADSDSVNINDKVYVFGYPAAGGDRITFTQGNISGFDNQTGGDDVDSFKTDAPISPGNSGGLATNENGDQIGIPTFATHADIGQGLGGIRMINLAVPYINQVVQLGDATPQPFPSETVVADTTPQPTPSADSVFGPITFGTDIEDGELVGQGTTFDSGTQQVLGVFAFQNMRNGMKWGAVWKYNGQVAIDQSNSNNWTQGNEGTNGVSISLDQGLPDGDYELDLDVGGTVVQTGTFTIGVANSVPTPEAPDPNQQGTGVTLKGQVVDADTQEGIANAAVLIMQPGTKLDDITQSNLQSLTVAGAVTDSDGFYITAPPIEAGNTYTVLILADGYDPVGYEDGLDIPATAHDLLQLDPLSLSKR
ncbi:MAG TPA: trypsin-like peptidase domain-containing protein [Chloroflexia bacterium]|nr:trypsin-like peptidase domain-containing protein [Chloroflexia bacterium]